MPPQQPRTKATILTAIESLSLNFLQSDRAVAHYLAGPTVHGYSEDSHALLFTNMSRRSRKQKKGC